MERDDACCNNKHGGWWNPKFLPECDGNTSRRSIEDEDLDSDVASMISYLNELTVQSEYHTPDETLQSKDTDSFINKTSEILCEITDLKSSSFTTVPDMSMKKTSTLISKPNSFSTALDVSYNNSYKEKSSLIDLTDSRSDDENLASVLEDIIEKLDEDIKENTDILNVTGNNSDVDTNESQFEYSRYTCTQSKYDDISEVFGDDEGNMSKRMSHSVYDQSISRNSSRVKDISAVYEDDLEIKYSPKNQSTALNIEGLCDGNEKDISVYNISSSSEHDGYLIKNEPNYPRETGVGQCSILEISSDLSLNNTEDDTLSHSYEDREGTEENLNTSNKSINKLLKKNESAPQELISFMENKTILEDIATGQENVHSSPSSVVNEHIVDHSAIGQSPFLNKRGNNVSLGNQSGSYKESNSNDSLGIIQLSMKNLDHTLFLSETKLTPSNMANGLFNKYHNSNVIEEVTEEDIGEESSNYNQHDKSLNTYARNEAPVESEFEEKSDVAAGYPGEGNVNNTDVNLNNTKNINYKTANLFGESSCTAREERKRDLDCSYKHKDLSLDDNERVAENNGLENLDDTLEEINRALEKGLDYSMSSQQSEDLISKTPAKPSTYKSQSARKPEKAKPVPSKLPISKYSHIISPISVYRNNPITQKNIGFKKPVDPVPKRSPAPGFQKNLISLNHIQSPVSHYIKNTPTTPLQQNAQTNRNTNKKLFTPLKTTKTTKENIPTLPSAIYKPASTKLVSTEKNFRLPNKIEKLVPTKPDIIKHQGRLVKHLNKNPDVESKLLGDDLTINGSIDASSLSMHDVDVSLLTSKKAFIK